MQPAQKLAIVTGAGSGIGRETSLALMRAGYSVILTGRRIEPLQNVVEAAAGLRGSGQAIVADVTNANSVAALFAMAQARFSHLDVLFNNAGIGNEARTPDELSVSEWRNCIDTILTGTFLCTREAFKWMRAQSPQGGRIINNGSVSAHTPRPGSLPYTAAKHGITGITKSTSLDGRKFGIACSQIDIGNVATEMTTAIAIGAVQADGSKIPEPQIEGRHVAEAILYIAELPLTANVQFMTLMATQMPFIGRG